VPVDVVAGLSGGALIGAYYCTLGDAGLKLAVSLGPVFGAFLPLNSISSWFMEKGIDFSLSCAEIEEAPVRYVAVTAALPSGDRPRSRLVTSGTVGEAVRVSSTLPPLFGPSKKSKDRYTDGGAASMVPAEIVRNCGADLTVSYNVLAGPNDGNPLSALPFGNLLRDLPVLGRMLDQWVWLTFIWFRASRQFGKFADVPIAFDQDAQMLEAVYWPLASWVAQWGYDDPEVIAKVAVVKAKWTTLQAKWP
jgi:predicted acylesterase/phospholipase RssA